MGGDHWPAPSQLSSRPALALLCRPQVHALDAPHAPALGLLQRLGAGFEEFAVIAATGIGHRQAHAQRDDARMAFLKRLSTFDVFGRGWTRRVEDVRCKARGMVA